METTPKAKNIGQTLPLPIEIRINSSIKSNIQPFTKTNLILIMLGRESKLKYPSLTLFKTALRLSSLKLLLQ